MRLLLLAAACVSLSLAACSSSSTTADPAPDAGPPPEVTFYKDVLPILQTSCQKCHAEGGVAPFALMTYEQTKAFAADVVTMTASRKMPPWGAQDTAECKHPRPLRDDMRLTEAQIATLAKWKDIGTPAGDPKDAPPAPAPRPPGLPNMEAELAPQQPYSLGSATTDQFRCFVLDPKLTDTRYLNGVHFMPGNASIVHHALLFSDPQRESLTRADASGAYDCFGGARTTGGTLLAGWAPGGAPMELPSNVGAPLTANTLLVMQIHYHPHANASATPDSTKVQVRFTKDAPEWLALTRLIGNFPRAAANGDGLLAGPNDPASGPTFTVPPNVAGHTETMLATMPATIPKLYVYGVGAHMHYVGTDEKVTVERAAPVSEPKDECLLHVPRWDFDWQRAYAYDAPIETLPTVSAGDRLRIRCTYDNTMNNPKLSRALSEQRLSAPKEVTLGESTLEEMCLGAFVFLTKRL